MPFPPCPPPLGFDMTSRDSLDKKYTRGPYQCTVGTPPLTPQTEVYTRGSYLKWTRSSCGIEKIACWEVPYAESWSDDRLQQCTFCKENACAVAREGCEHMMSCRRCAIKEDCMSQTTCFTCGVESTHWIVLFPVPTHERVYVREQLAAGIISPRWTMKFNYVTGAGIK